MLVLVQSGKWKKKKEKKKKVKLSDNQIPCPVPASKQSPHGNAQQPMDLFCTAHLASCFVKAKNVKMLLFPTLSKN